MKIQKSDFVFPLLGGYFNDGSITMFYGHNQADIESLDYNRKDRNGRFR